MKKADVTLAVVLVALASSGCDRKADPGATLDAGRPAATARVVPVRVAAAGETLADLQKSSISLAIVKDHDVEHPVTATMALREGVLLLSDPTPSARFTFDLTTFESLVPMRNERVETFFFETSAKDTAELTVPKLPEAAVAALKDRKPLVHAKTEGNLTLHGKTVNVTLSLDAGYDAKGVLWVKTGAPAEVKISDFGLTENAKRLMSLCMHDSIDDVVKVDAALEFRSH